jgi:hypothetical protein
MARTIPNVNNDDVDVFEEELGDFLLAATVNEIGHAVQHAAQFIEDLCETHLPGHLGAMDQVNNATSTLCSAYSELANRIKELEDLVETLKASRV